MRNKFFEGALLLAFCMHSACFNPCKPADERRPTLESGSYKGTVGSLRATEDPAAQSRQAVIDREAGTATLRFMRNGQQVVEVWTLTPSQSM